MKKIVCISLAVLVLLSGCGLIDGSDNDLPVDSYPTNVEQTYDKYAYEVRDPDYFFLKTIESEMGNFYKICYRFLDGHEVVVLDQGDCDSPFFVIGDRIYCIGGDGAGLQSVDYEGKNSISFTAYGETDYTITRLVSTDGEWIVCQATKYAEITNDPNAAPGTHVVDTYIKVKTDFSEFMESND